MRLIVDGSTHYQTSSIVMFERRAFAVQKGYWLSSASLTLAAKNDSWSIAAYINNIENTYVYGSSFYNSGVGITQGNYGPPRTYGAKMSFKF
jgi:iron complex outermembrane recepter protein